MSIATINNPYANISIAPARIELVGHTAVERKLSVLETANPSVCLALAGESGKVGQAARAGCGALGIEGIINSCSNNQFKSLAQWLAVKLDRPIVISSRAAYYALPDYLEGLIMAEQGKKNGGWTTDKDGAQVPTKKVSMLLGLKADVTEVIARADEIFKARAAERAERVKLEATERAEREAAERRQMATESAQ